MKFFFTQQKPIESDPGFAQQANLSGGPKSYNKVILRDIEFGNKDYWSKIKDGRRRVKLYRFRKATVNAIQDPLSFLRSPQNVKSLKSVRDVEISNPVENYSSFFRKNTPNRSPQVVAKLTKASKVKLSLQAYGSANGLTAGFSEGWFEVFKELRKYDPKKLKIRITSSWYRPAFPSAWNIVGKLLWWRYTFRLIEFMKNIRLFDLVVWTSDRTQFNDDSIVRNHMRPIKNLSKLKEVVLAGIERLINDPVIIYKHFLEAPALENVAIRIHPEINQAITEALNNTPHLKNLIIQDYMEISELFSVAKAHPELNQIQICHSWNHEIENIPIDTLSQGLQLQNITRLHLDYYLPIQVKEDCEFYRKFMTVFVNLDSLHIGFKMGKKNNFAEEYTQILLPLKKITRLELALTLSLENFAKFFTKMPSLSTLKHFRLAADVGVPKNVLKVIDQNMEPFKKYLSTLTNLESFEMHCHKIGIVFLQSICQIMLGFQKLQSLTLSFETNSDRYIPLHDTMLNEIQKTVETITNVKELYITMVCGGFAYTQIPQGLLKCQNEHLKKYKFTIGGRFYLSHRWFCGLHDLHRLKA